MIAVVHRETKIARSDHRARQSYFARTWWRQSPKNARTGIHRRDFQEPGQIAAVLLVVAGCGQNRLEMGPRSNRMMISSPA